MMRSFTTILGILVISYAVHAVQSQPPSQHQLRLYIFDCGTLEGDPTRYNLKREEIGATDMSVGCYLVVHPSGTLIWDTGAVPDTAIDAENKAVRHELTLMNNIKAYVTVSRSLKNQLTAIGYAPKDIKYLAMSHYHFDHTANSNEFTDANWLGRQVERDAMFAVKPPSVIIQPATFDALRHSKTTIINTDDYDVFHDGSVVIKWAPGHTAGHQVLFVRLARTGPVLLSGDLYHYPEERTLDRVPAFEFDPVQTRKTRTAIEGFIRRTSATLWIQHDFRGTAKLRKAPAFYD